ncbi:hypothetical protein ONE63_003313 [Megalurothrips usitatus]|uniref:Protein sleepless n=1 Tax=Megalurothrips usitatus TaxID=439358 RepID=A0AAV7X6X1_9NEOP|nr:hypothetical protein ONE63_003313 [Megalurothrips usitatus]
MSGARTSPGAAVLAVAAVLLAGLSCFHSGAEAIVCYDCNSEYDPRCGDPFDPYTLGQIDCGERQSLDHLSGANATLCRKLVQRTAVGVKTRVIRTCGYIEEPGRDGGCVSRSGTHDVNVLYCSCKGNLCNGAAAATAGPLLPLAVSAVGVLVAAASLGRRLS